MPRKPATQFLFEDVTTTGAQTAYQLWGHVTTFHGFGNTTSGAGASVFSVEVSNDNVNWIIMGTFTLVLSTTVVVDGFSAVVPWRYYRGNVDSISGTGAKVSLIVGNLPA